ncbi:MAG: gluconate 2-dehydrogenase subunit 3 family protein [Gemmatimonadetes bacterium]|nr:gluconate 2-dehydrogenase subunit 3 family protein [Gemmatimonadota bacterium]
MTERRERVKGEVNARGGERGETVSGEQRGAAPQSRRDVLKAVAGAAAVVALPITPADAERALAHVEAALESEQQGTAYRPKYFQPDEWRTIRVVADMIIPRDARSGSATQAGVPQYMDFFCTEYPSYSWMREALRWFDGFAYNRFKKSFYRCTDLERRALVDQVAWPAKTAPELREGANYFSRLRDFTASGFFSSQMGVKDIGYQGNVAIPVWNGCPPAALKHLGVDT